MHALESTDTPGLYKRKGTFWCRIQVGKKTRERSLRTTSKNAAIETMSRWRREMGITAARSAHAGGNDKRDTIGWWLVRLRHKYRRDPQTSAKHKLFIAERVQAIKASWPALLKMRPDAATPTQIGVWMDAQLAGRGQKAKSPRTVSGNMLVLELALDLAVAAGTLTVNPLEGIKKPRPSKQMFSKKHQISPETFDTILDSTRKKPGFARQGADLAELMASTGMRIGEANLLTWANVDWGRRELVAHNGKGRIRSGTQNDVKRLPFHPRLEALLRRLWGNGQKLDSRVATVSQCSGTLESACKAAGIPKLTQHDMRHLFATWCIEAGVDIPTVATWLGHRDGGALLMKTYHHLRAVHSHSQAEKLSSLAPKRPIDPASDVSQVNPGPR
jgi:integrase